MNSIKKLLSIGLILCLFSTIVNASTKTFIGVLTVISGIVVYLDSSQEIKVRLGDKRVLDKDWYDKLYDYHEIRATKDGFLYTKWYKLYEDTTYKDSFTGYLITYEEGYCNDGLWHYDKEGYAHQQTYRKEDIIGWRTKSEAGMYAGGVLVIMGLYLAISGAEEEMREEYPT